MFTIEEEHKFKTELQQLVDNHPRSYFSSLKTAKLKYLLDYINFKTSKLQDNFYKISTKVCWVLTDRIDFPICPTCGKQYGQKQNISATPRKNGSLGYNGFCSIHCLNKSEYLANKIKNTLLKKYGVENAAQSKIVKEKIKQTCLEKYGVEYVTQSDTYKAKTKKTWLKKYGVSNPNKVKAVREKIKETCLDRYGAEYYFQTEECAKTRKSRIFYDNCWFDSKAELVVYKWCKERNLRVIRTPGSLKFKFEGKTHYYYPDFLIEGRYVEVKGDHFFKIDEETGEETLGSPFVRRSTGKLSKELLEKTRRLDAAKFKCMKDNNVLIIKTSQLDQLDKIFTKQKWLVDNN